MTRNRFQIITSACMCVCMATALAVAGPVEGGKSLKPFADAPKKVAGDASAERGGSPRGVIGACCDAGGTCVPLAQVDCDAVAGTFLGVGIACFPNPCPQPVQCQFVGNAWVSQDPPNPTTDTVNLSESDENSGTTASEFFIASGWITDVRWYGVYSCDRLNDDFIITLFDDAAGPGLGPTQPGPRIISQQTVTAVRVPADVGGTFNGLPAQRFTATLPARVAAGSGWVQIQAVSDGTNCRFRWVNTTPFAGDDLSMANGSPVPYDLSLCLEGSDFSDIVGACCDDGAGTCNDAPFAFFGCTGPGFRFTGDTTCAAVTPACGQVPGACCNPVDGACIENTGPECDVLYGPGNWQGAFTTCLPISPCKGACCAADTGNCTVQTETDCLNALGTYMGDGTDCTTAACPGTGRCCRDAGTTCDIRTEPSCTALGGDSWIADATCLTSPCPVPQPNDSCTTATPLVPPFPAMGFGNTTLALPDTTPTCGTSTPFQGVWFAIDGTGNTMTASTCGGASWDTKIQVFCQDCIGLPCVGGNDDACALQSSVSWCSAQGAVYYIMVGGFGAAVGPFTLTVADDGIPCVPDATCAPLGSCCLPDGSCQNLVQAACAAASGTYGGDDTACGGMGACCIPIQGCITSDQICCEAAGGLFMGFGSDCITQPCLGGTGACCVNDTTCNDGWTNAACQTAGGRYLGIDTVCAPGICLILGACCNPTDGTCSEVTVMTCTAQGGTYHGDWVTCLETTCPGACCFFGNPPTCLFLSPTDCGIQGGNFVGEEVTCASIVCPDCENCPSSYTDDGTGATPADDAITNVTFGMINNTTGPEMGNLSYGDYRSISTDVSPGQILTLSVTVDSCTDGGPWLEQAFAWIDWNQNCNFDEVGEIYDLGDNATQCLATMTLDITVPADALPGITTMRVIEQYFDDPGPCDAHPDHAAVYGETEDYGINVVVAPGACCISPTNCQENTTYQACLAAGGWFRGPGVLCAGLNCGIVGACCNPADGSCTEVSATDCAAAGGSYAGDFALCATTDCHGACCFGDASCQEFMMPADCAAQGGTYQGEQTVCSGVTCPLCSYCPSSYTDDGGPGVADDAITNVTFNTINNTTGAEIGNLSYNDYTAISTAVAPGVTYTVFVTVDSCVDGGPWTQHVWVWIDWNQNCVLDDVGEAYDLGDNGGVCVATLQLDITVPVTAVPGPTRMRVIEEYGSDPGPCDGDGLHATIWGETEDYTVIVAGGDPGACCTNATTCVDGQDAVACVTAGGRFMGPGVLCSTVDCTITGACCDPLTGNCTVEVPADCAAAGGLYIGDFVPCGATTCAAVIGACCLPDGSCQEGIEYNQCVTTLGGSFQGSGSICTPSGACCIGAGCIVTSQVCCGGAGGSYVGDGTNCGASAGNPTTYDSGFLALPLDSLLPPAVHTINVPDTGAIGDVDILVVATHTYIGDFEIDVMHNGTTVRVMDNQCGSSDNMSITWDDEGAAIVCAAGGAPTNGVFIPFAALSAFDGMEMSGDWTITVADIFGGDTGTLDSWAVIIDGVGVGPCDGPGACCLTETTCQDNMDIAACTAAGGRFQGPGVLCATVDCTITGACCDPLTGNCTVETPAVCAAAGGLYIGDFAPCTGTTCTAVTGACCLPDGTCQEGIEYNACVNTLLGSFQGADTLCLPSGACCMPAGCIVTSQACCEGAGGSYVGDGTSCDGLTAYGSGAVALAITDNDPLGITHVINVPDSSTITDIDVGLMITHTWVGDLCVTIEHNGTIVEVIQRSGAVDAPPTGTCHAGAPFGCDSDDYDIVLDDAGIGGMIEDICGATGADPTPTSPPNYIPFSPLSVFNGMDAIGAWTITVADNGAGDLGTLESWQLIVNGGGAGPCDGPGACCLSEVLCQELDFTTCNAQGGRFQGSGTLCAQTDCTIRGACCDLVNGGCTEQTPAACQLPDFDYQGDFTTCAQVTCSAIGACCYGPGDIDCVAPEAESVCVAGGGRFMGPGSACTPGICLITGACCDLVNGGCTEQTAANCQAPDFAYQGDSSTCAQVTCPAVLGACCSPNGTCAEGLESAACTAQGSSWVGPNTTCPVTQGACCFANGDCLITNVDCCGAAGGTYSGDGTNCGSASGSPTAYPSALGLGVVVPNGGAASHTITVGDSFAVADVIVDFDLQHGFIGVVAVSVAHGGTTVMIVDRPGNPALGSFGCNNQNLVLTLDDAGTGGAVEDLCVTPTGSPFPTSPPSYTPNEALSAFDDMDAAGDWTITVTNTVAGMAGTLNSWAVHIDHAAGGACSGTSDCATCLADVNGDNVLNGMDVAAFTDVYLGVAPYAACADMNGDLAVNEADLNTFVAMLVGGTGPCGGAAVCLTCMGDANGDGVLDGADIDMFVQCAMGQALCPCADMNGDLNVTSDDIAAFIDAIVNQTGSCP